MSSAETRISPTRFLHPTGIFNLARRAYTGLPARLSSSGWALPPLQYIFEITRRCNLQCRMCLNNAWRENTPVDRQCSIELSTDEWRAVIDQVRSYAILSFTGGEVFVRGDFLDLLEYAGKRHFTHLMSNLTLMNRGHAETLARLAAGHLGRLGLMVVGTSLDGPAKEHDSIRSLSGAFELTQDAIRMLIDAREAVGKRCPRIHVTTVIQEANVHALPEMPKIAKSLGADELILLCETRMYDIHPERSNNPTVAAHGDVPWPRIDRDKLRRALAGCAVAARSVGMRVRFPRMTLEDILDYYDGKRFDLVQYLCRAPWYMQGVDLAGNVGSCGYGLVGNVRDERLADLWNGAKQRGFRMQRRERPFVLCSGCCLFEHDHGPEAAVL